MQAHSMYEKTACSIFSMLKVKTAGAIPRPVEDRAAQMGFAMHSLLATLSHVPCQVPSGHADVYR